MIQKKIAKFLFSTRLMAALFIIFAVSMAIGTFVEDAYSTEFARIYIYNTKWFELLMVLLAVNFLGNISKYSLWTNKKKWPTLLLHLSFLFIIVGAGITRYISYEGMMPIREGQAENSFYSNKTFVTAYIDGNHNGQMLRKKDYFHVILAEGANNHRTFHTDFKGQPVTFEITKFIDGAKRSIVADKKGDRYLKIVMAGSNGREDHFLKEGKVTNIHNILFALNKKTPGAINIFVDEQNNYTIKSPFSGTYMRMADRKKGKVKADTLQKLMRRSLYNMAGIRFVFPDPIMRGRYELMPDSTADENAKDGVFMTIKTNGKTQQISLLGSRGRLAPFKDVKLGDLTFHLRYGSKEYELPFSIKLKDFIANKYPGTADNPTPSYESFESKVKVINPGESFDYRIYMNHILNYNGYRFFQSSFMPDEKGTVLSVSHDFWGTLVTYIGYSLLYLGLILILFIPGSRFKNLEKKLRKIKKIKKKDRTKITGVLAFLLMMSSVMGYAQVRKQDIPGYDKSTHQNTVTQIDTATTETHENHSGYNIIGDNLSTEEVIATIKARTVPKKYAAKFSALVMQDYQGRMKPINTYSSELLRKLSGGETYKGLNSDQVLISMLQNPALWFNVPLIEVPRHNTKLRDLLGVEKGQDLVKFTQFFDAKGHYKFAPFLQDAYRAKRKSKFQKDLVEMDGKVNLLYNALRGKLVRIFPVPNDSNNKWLSYPEVMKNKAKFSGVDSLFVTNALPLYFRSLTKAQQDGNYTSANSILEGIKKFQRKFGAEVIPSQEKIKAELLYNKYNIFQNLFWQYLVAGAFLFFFVILEIFYQKSWVRGLIIVGKIAVILLFIIHTITLIARWYISGHVPWSNAYETMIYVAWATMLFGLVFGRKSDLTVASTAFVTSMILMIAHWNWLDPAIGHMQPVLDSYWIMIHTSIIVASYGPFTLGAILGIVALVLTIFTNKNNQDKMKLNVKEVTIITEMALTVGLVMLTIGNFLGGQWANESWGRYWGWDPKETWAMISIIVYAFVIHMRLVPGLRSRFAFNWVAIIAYASILFTYFGVNFYLSGLHSYASGEQIISYKFIAISLGIWFLLGGLAYRKHRLYYKKSKPKKVE